MLILRAPRANVAKAALEQVDIVLKIYEQAAPSSQYAAHHLVRPFCSTNPAELWLILTIGYRPNINVKSS